MNEFFKNHLGSIISAFFIIMTANMYFYGYIMEGTSLGLLNIPKEMIELKSPNYYITTSALYIVVPTFIVFPAGFLILNNAQCFISNLSKFKQISILMVFILTIEISIFFIASVMFHKIYDFSLDNKRVIKEFKNKDEILKTNEEIKYHLIYQNNNFLFISKTKKDNTELYDLNVINKNDIQFIKF